MLSKVYPKPAAVLLRVSLGVMYLTHSLVLKLATYGLAGTVGFFQSIGLPPAVAYLTIAAEVIGGTLLVLGIGTRAVALALVPILLGAVWVHAGNGWVFSNAGGGWEYPVFLIVVSAAVALSNGAALHLPAQLRRLFEPAAGRATVVR